eukprot:Platyproteum_vivax@DN7715_c0_g1_i1.p1
MISNAIKMTKKHYGKMLIVAFVVGGVAYVSHKIYKKYAEMKAFLALTTGQLERELLSDVAFGDSTTVTKEWKMTLLFLRNQKVSDQSAKRNLDRLKQNIFSLYKVEEMTGILRNRDNELTFNEKSRYFNNIKVQVYSRAVACLYAVHFLLLLLRIEINIVGREMNQFENLEGGDIEAIAAPLEPVPSTQEGVPYSVGSMKPGLESLHRQNFAFLSSTGHIQETEGLEHITNTATAAVENALGRWNPGHEVSWEELEEAFKTIRQDMDSALILNGNAVRILLPDNIPLETTSLTEAEEISLGQMVSEARDLLDSPQFICAAQILMDTATSHVISLLKEKCGHDVEFPLARTFGKLAQIADSLLTSTFTNTFIQEFSHQQVVDEFAKMIYFPPNFDFSKAPQGGLLDQLLAQIGAMGSNPTV